MQLVSDDGHVPTSVQKQLLDLWHRGQRIKEEETLVKAEMHRLCKHYINQQAILCAGLEKCIEEGNPSRTLVFRKLFHLESRYREVITAFGGHLEDIPAMTYFVSVGPADDTVYDSDNSGDEGEEEALLDSASSDSEDSD